MAEAVVQRRQPARALGAALLAFLLLGAAAAASRDLPLTIDLGQAPAYGDLEAMAQRRAIRVLVPYSRTLYFVDYGGAQRGLVYEFLHEFEADLNRRLHRPLLRVHVVFIPVPFDRLLPLLTAGRGDVAAANLTVTPGRAAEVDFTAPLASGVREIVVTGPGAPPLSSLDDLAGLTVYAPPATSYEDSLADLSRQLVARGRPAIRVRAAPAHLAAEDLLEMVHSGLLPVIVVDDYLARFWAPVFPALELHPALVVREKSDVAFAVRRDSPQLRAALNDFIDTHRAGTLFGNVELQKYLGQASRVHSALGPEELARFRQLVGLFRRYGEQYEIDWLLMAAQGYQESGLDQSRRSRVGAVGVMQVTPATGRQMGVGDITELEPNIHAGVKYVRYLADHYYADGSVDALNRVLFAFAAYNAGPERIRSARHEAARRHLDPNLWFDHVERVVAERVGLETVQYVSNIYKYFVAYTLSQEDLGRTLPPAPRGPARADRDGP